MNESIKRAWRWIISERGSFLLAQTLMILVITIDSIDSSSYIGLVWMAGIVFQLVFTWRHKFEKG